MQPRPTIFDSQNERELFHAVHGTWEPEYRVYPHIPFTNLIDLDPQAFDAAELGFLHKTTVDYVLTTADGRPLLAVEFDGLGHGASRQGRYVQRVNSRKDPNRAWKLGLKCRAADEAGFPFAVVSYEEKEVVDPEVNLVVAHGIIGGFLAHGYAGRRLQELVDEQREIIEALPAEEQSDYLQDCVDAAEIEGEMMMDPLAKRVPELERACEEAGLLLSGHGVSWPDDEPPPSEADPASKRFSPAARLKWWDGLRRMGATVRVFTSAGEFERTAWIRNIDLPGTTPAALAEEVAHTLALRAALEFARNNSFIPHFAPVDTRDPR